MPHNLLTDPRCNGREDFRHYRGLGGFGWIESTGTDEIIDLMRTAGVRGRGGSGRGRPVAETWALVGQGQVGQRYVVVNGAESSPGSKKDRYLMERFPYRILDGALAAGRAVGADTIYVYIKATATAALESMERAVMDLQSSGLDEGLPRFEWFRAPDTAVSGEATAICDAIEGLTGLPQVKPPIPEVFGLFGRPTLVANVETFAAAAAILREGPQRFIEAGGPGAPGSVLVTLGGDLNRPGVYEVPLGTPIRRLIEEYGGGATDRVQAVLPGGFRSGPLTPEELDLPLEYDALQQAGTTLGPAHVVVLAQPNSLIDLLVGALELAAAGSCKQCAICGEGTFVLRSLVGRIADGEASEPLREEIRYLSHIYYGKGNCGFLSGVSLLTRRAVERFPNWR